MGAAQYSRVKNGKTDPSVSTLVKIAKEMGVFMAELYTDNDVLRDVNSIDTTFKERAALIDSLSKEEQKTIFLYLMPFFFRSVN